MGLPDADPGQLDRALVIATQTTTTSTSAKHRPIAQRQTMPTPLAKKNAATLGSGGKAKP